VDAEFRFSVPGTSRVRRFRDNLLDFLRSAIIAALYLASLITPPGNAKEKRFHHVSNFCSHIGYAGKQRHLMNTRTGQPDP
jgi:hypothetical protein